MLDRIMHEMGIANSILEAAQTESARRAEGETLTKIGVRIGEFAGVDPESLRFCFEALIKGTEFEPLQLEIAWCRAGDLCNSTRRYSGEELELAFLEFDGAEENAKEEVAV